MIKHIVMIRLKESEIPDQKNKYAKQIRRMLVDLVDKIHALKEMEVGMNFNPKSEYDLVLISGFESKHDLELYRSHPEHVKVLEFLKKVMDGTAVVDYEI